MGPFGKAKDQRVEPVKLDMRDERHYLNVMGNRMW